MIIDKMSIEGLLGQALSAAEKRHQVIANNIANVDTPGFKAQRLAFEELLSKALERGEAGVAPQILSTKTAAGPDGNNVQLEEQIAEMLKNSTLYKTYMRILADRYKQMELAIRGDRQG